MRNIASKFTSRKFLAMIGGLVSGLAVAFGLDEGVITSVAGAVASIVSVVAYIVTEGKIDREALHNAVDELANAADAVEIIGFKVDGDE